MNFFLICGAIKEHKENKYNEIRNYLNNKQNYETIILDTVMQKYACSKHGYITKLWNNTKHTAKNSSKPKEFNITVDDIIKIYDDHSICTISGVKLTMIGYQNKGINLFNMSIDRINSNIGYNPNNIQLVCAIVNLMKWDSNNKEFIDMCEKIAIFNNYKIQQLIKEV